MIPAPFHPHEAARLAELRRYAILDSEPENAFDRVTRLASAMYEAPIAVVSFIDGDRQWIKSRVGIDVRETSRETSFCAHAILERKALVVEDAAKDPRFVDNPLVVGPPHVRFYAGVPLMTPRGAPLGTLAVIDSVPRADVDTEPLAELAALVMDALEMRAKTQAVQKDEASLKREHAIVAAAMAHIQDGVALLDADRRILFANAAYADVFGLPSDGIVGLTRDDFIAHAASLMDEPAPFVDRILELSTQTVHVSDEFVFQRPRKRVLRRTVKPLEMGHLVVWHDVTAERQLIAERERLLLTDGLTGIPNRRAGEAALARELARMERDGTPLSLAVLDVDHFKRVNDMHGHAAGDEVLRQIATVLTSEARLTDTVVRWGGEEFVAVLPVRLDGARAFCQRVRAALERLPTRYGSITISAGVIEVAEGETALEAIVRADDRLYEAKRAGRNRVAA